MLRRAPPTVWRAVNGRGEGSTAIAAEKEAKSS